MLAYLDTLIGFAVLMLGISLLITILNQIVSALLAHRGSNLRWGLEVLFKQLDPSPAGLPLLAAQARNVAETILTHPLVSDSIFSTKWIRPVLKRPRLLALVKRWQLATGIRPNELSAVLTQIITVRPIGLSKNLHAALRRELGLVLKAPSAAAIRDATLSTTVAAGVAPLSLADKVVGNSPSSTGNLEEVFGKVMDRIRQRFTMWMRIWTIAFAFAIAGFGCVDSIAIIQAIYKNSALRAQLVSAAPQTTASALRLMPGVTQLFTGALSQAAQGKTDVIPGNINSESDAVSWINTNIPAASRPAVKQAFDANVQTELKNRGGGCQPNSWDLIGQWSSEVQREDLGKSAQPSPQPIGVLITALLLSLGAPFWFNTLSSFDESSSAACRLVFIATANQDQFN